MKDSEYYGTASSHLSLNSIQYNEIKNIRSDENQNVTRKSKRKCKLHTKVNHQSSLNLQPLISHSKNKKQKYITKFASMPYLMETNTYIVSTTAKVHSQVKRCNTLSNCNELHLNYLNSEYDCNSSSKYYNYRKQIKFKVYRCQLKTTRESCCCSCNSDAMFEVMKGLYDCYKMKDCNHCNCVLCGHKQKEDQLIGEIIKSLASVGLDTSGTKRKKEQTKEAEKDMEGKPLAEKEKILRDLATSGAPLPKGKSASEKSLIKKVRRDLGLPPEPKTANIKSRLKQAAKAGLLTPLEGKTNAQKEKILEGLHDVGIPLPEGRTLSEKSLIAKIAKKPRKGSFLTPSEKKRKSKDESLIQPLDGKTSKQKEKILKNLAHRGLPLPKGKTESEKKLINKVRADLGLPPEPKTQAMRDKHTKAADAGLLQPLDGKTPKEKENILRGLRDFGIPLPEGRTPSEKALISNVLAEPRKTIVLSPSEKVREAKAAGLITPLQGKTPEHKEKILRGLAEQGISLPEGKTISDKKLIDKVRADLGLPPEPKKSAMRHKYAKAADAGLMEPLEGKSPKDKKRILQGLHNAGIPLPEGRTPSEKSLIAKVEAEPLQPSPLTPSERKRKTKLTEIMTPLEGKTPEQKEKILKRLAEHGIPLPEGKSVSEKKILKKIRDDLGLPPESKNSVMRNKYANAATAGLLKPLKGKSAKEKEHILRGLHNLGIPLPKVHTPSDKALIAKIMAELPEGRTPSEKSLIAKIAKEPRQPSILAPSEKIRKAKAVGLLTPLQGKSPEQKEKILRGLANLGLPLPEGKTASENKLLDKVRTDLGLPPEPKSQEMRDKHLKASDAGFLLPLEGKTPEEKKNILRRLHNMDIPLPEGRTPSEKSLIAKIEKEPREPSILAPSEKIRKAKVAGLYTPLQGKTPEQKEKVLRGFAELGLPLPEGKTPSEKNIVNTVRVDLGLPPEPTTPAMRDKYAKAADAGLLQPLEGKTPIEKKNILRGLYHAGIPLPEGRTPSEKSLIAKVAAEPRKFPLSVPSNKIYQANAAGLLTPLDGKTPEQKEKILRGLAELGLSLPEGKTPSEMKILDQVRTDLGLPPEPKTPGMKDKHAKAADAGFLQPLEGKTTKEKTKILRGLHNIGIPLPEGRTPSEKALVAKIGAEPRALSLLAPSEKIRKAKAAGLLTPLQGKTPEQKEKILRGLAKHGLPLPEGKTASVKKLLNKVRTDLGLPPEPETPIMRERHAKAADAGLLQPLEGKSPNDKKKILQGLYKLGIPLPEGRTASEKSLIARIVSKPRKPSLLAPSEKLRKAIAAGVITPLEGKLPEEKEKILKGLAEHGLPLPEGKTVSEKKLLQKVRAKLGLPPEPLTQNMRDKHAKAAKAGLLFPLEGKSPKEKEDLLKGLAYMDIPLPVGRTPSEKALINKIKAAQGGRKKLDENTTKIMTEGKGPTDICICDQLTPESEKVLKHIPSISAAKIQRAKNQGLFTPLAGKSPKEQEKILRKLATAGLPLPKGETPAEKSLIKQVKEQLGVPEEVPAEKIRKAMAAGVPLPAEKLSQRIKAAKAAGLLTPLKGKTPAEKEKILRGLLQAGIPLPETKTSSEIKLMNKIRAEAGLPPEPKTPALKEKYKKALANGLITPLQGKTPAEKANIIRKLHDAGIPLPEGRTPSEKSMIKKAKAGLLKSPTPSQKLQLAKAAGLLTPLTGKSPEQRKKILKNLLQVGVPLPEGKTSSQKDLIAKVRSEVGLPRLPTTLALKEKYKKAEAAGVITPLAGKLPEEKENILRKLNAAGIPLPEGKSPSEKAMIKKVNTELRKPSTLSQRQKAAKAAGLLTPLEGKTPEHKKKILQGLAKVGVPLPESTTPSLKEMIVNIRAETGLPPEPKTPSMKEKYNKALADGIITPLEGKTPSEKENILRKLLEAGLPLPEGRTPSEKAMIKRIKAEAQKPRTASKKLDAAKGAGLLTPLEGKPPKQKEEILKGLAQLGLPLTEGKTPSEKKLINKIRAETGLPPEPKTPSIKEKYNKAVADGIITPLEGKTPAEKENILRKLLEAGLPLPEGRTPSEKAMIKRVTAETLKPHRPSQRLKAAKAASKKLDAAKGAGLLTHLEGKTPEQKEKILKDLVKAGLPLPEAKTPSEKKLIKKIRPETGLPPVPKIPSMKEKYNKAVADGIITPLEGKTPAEKEKIVRGLIDAGLPLPKGRTKSEKSLIRKARDTTGLLDKGTKSEKLEKIRKKTIGVSVEAKEVHSKAGIVEDLEEITKTTVCDHACGCDKKKIRFKHSYVKIRVTSPDVSSLCPCPEECIPGVKKGVFVDNEGIKVTIGSVVSIPSYFRTSAEVNKQHSKENIKLIKSASDYQNQQSYNIQEKTSKPLKTPFPSEDKLKYILAKNYQYNSGSSENSSLSDNSLELQKHSNNSKTNLKSSSYFKTMSELFGTSVLRYYNNYVLTENVPEMSASILILKSETSLSFTSCSGSTDSSSTISITDDSEISNTARNLNSISDMLINVKCLASRDKRYVIRQCYSLTL